MKKQQKTDYCENIIKPSLFPEKPPFSSTLICKSKPNFNNLSTTLTHEKKGTYNDFYPQTNKKSKPNPNPIKANFKHHKTLTFSRRTLVFAEPLFEEQTQFQQPKNDRNPYGIEAYNDFYPKTQNGTNPNEPNFKTQIWRKTGTGPISRSYSDMDRLWRMTHWAKVVSFDLHRLGPQRRPIEAGRQEQCWAMILKERAFRKGADAGSPHVL